MREITTQEATAVVGGVQEVHITKKKDDGSASTAALMGAVHNSGGNSAGGGGGGGSSPAVTTTVTCVDTIVQVSQAATGLKTVEFGVKGIKAETIPKIEHVTRTSVCTTVKTQSSR